MQFYNPLKVVNSDNGIVTEPSNLVFSGGGIKGLGDGIKRLNLQN